MYVQAGPVAVWLQLLERCAAEPGCQPIILRSLAQQLVEQRVQSEKELVESRAVVAHQQQQIARLQQHQEQQTSAQQQSSAHQQVVAEQGALIAGLRDQLQEMRAELQQLRQQRLH